MALRVNYKTRYGYYLDKSADGKTRKVWFCRANALCAMINFYREEKEGKRVDMVQLCGFFADKRHAKACIEDGFFNRNTGFTFFAKELDNANIWELIKLLTKHGIKVTIK